MSPIDYYLQLNYKTSIYRDEDGDFVAEVDDLPGCTTHGSTPGEAFQNVEEAKRVWLESRLQAGLEIPEPRGVEQYSGKFLVRVPRSLHKRLVEQSSAEGVSLNQYVVSLLADASSVRQARGRDAVGIQLASYIAGFANEATYSQQYMLGSTDWRCDLLSPPRQFVQDAQSELRESLRVLLTQLPSIVAVKKDRVSDESVLGPYQLSA